MSASCSDVFLMGSRSHVLSTQIEAYQAIQDLARRDSYARDILRECDQRMKPQTKHFFLESEPLLVQSHRALAEPREGDLICAAKKYVAMQGNNFFTWCVAHKELSETIQCYILCAPFYDVKRWQPWF